MELKDYYFILGVPHTATARDILRAYRERAKLYHPDRGGPQSTATFQDIVEAYAVLSNPERRRHYNHTGVALFRRCSLDDLQVRNPAGSLRVARLGDRAQT